MTEIGVSPNYIKGPVFFHEKDRPDGDVQNRDPLEKSCPETELSLADLATFLYPAGHKFSTSHQICSVTYDT